MDPTEARRLYGRNYYARNRDKIREYHRQWQKDHPDKVKMYLDRYWQKKADELNRIEQNEQNEQEG